MIVVIDGTNWAWREWHSPALLWGTSSKHGSFGRRLEIVRDFVASREPSTMLAAFDSGRSFRHDLLDGYKAGRERPAGIDEHLERCQRMAETNGFRVVVSDGFEADDILATVAHRANGDKVVLGTTDKDAYQLLVPDKVTMLRKAATEHGKLKAEWRRAAEIPALFHGVTCRQWIDYQCLAGDATDKIPGVEGVGPVMAARLLKERGTLAEIIRNPWVRGIGDKIRTRLTKFSGEQEQLMRKLVTLRTDVPI